MDEHIYYTKNAQETEELGIKIAHNLQPEDVVFLYGDLGAGKTTFVKGIAKGLGITSRIISPTFVIVRSHTNGKKIKTLYHIDLYRLKDSKEVDQIGLQETLQDKDAVTIIEWPELIEKKISKKLRITFEVIDENQRKVTVL